MVQARRGQNTLNPCNDELAVVISTLAITAVATLLGTPIVVVGRALPNSKPPEHRQGLVWGSEFYILRQKLMHRRGASASEALPIQDLHAVRDD